MNGSVFLSKKECIKMLKVKNVPLEEIKEYENNPRRIPEEAVNAVAASIREFGFRVPVVVDSDKVIIAGHTRVLAARQLGMSEVPCVIVDDLTPEQIKAFRLADNKTGELSGWDFEKLDFELKELADIDIDMGEFGFDLSCATENYIDDLMNVFGGSERNVESDYFSITFTIDKGQKEKFDKYIEVNGKEMLKNALIEEVSRIA